MTAQLMGRIRNTIARVFDRPLPDGPPVVSEASKRAAAKLAAAQLVTHWGEWPRVPQGHDSGWSTRADGSCSECNAAPGQLHIPGCEGEECPVCPWQGIGCGCGIVRCACGCDHNADEGFEFVSSSAAYPVRRRTATS
jgi:hypothetical protein